MAYRIGELRERVTIRRTSESADAYGALVPTTTDVATVWALVRPMSGGERSEAQKTEATAMYLVVVRYRDDIRDDDAIIWRGSELNIRLRKDRGPASMFLEIEAERGVAT